MMLDIIYYSPMSVGEGIERSVMAVEPYPRNQHPWRHNPNLNMISTLIFNMF